MKVTGQIYALESRSFDPLSHLVVRRVVASTLIFPIVVALAMVVGVLSGWVASLTLLDITTHQVWQCARISVDFDVRYGLVKAASLGAAVSLIGCKAGLETERGAQGVGDGTTKAVVISAVMILVLGISDGAMTSHA